MGVIGSLNSMIHLRTSVIDLIDLIDKKNPAPRSADAVAFLGDPGMEEERRAME